YPINDGSFRSLKTIVPPGRVISAVRPAPMRWWMTYPMTIVDTIFKALAPAIPGRVIAGHHADLLASSFHGINNRTSEFFIGSFGPLGGGWGAKLTEDGVSGTVCINDGDTHNSPNEQAEFKFPIVVERYALVPDSGGAGRRRGGLGVERVVRARTNMVVNNQSERAHCRAWGLDGGLDGTGNAVELRIGGQWKSDFPNAKVLVAQLKPGDAFKIRSGGGGGYGNPLERPTEQVRDDVRQGYVTAKSAAELYAVVLDPQTFEVDAAATERLGGARRSGGGGAAAARWAWPARGGRDSRRRFSRPPLWGQRHLPFELGCERHRAGAATGAAHGDENVLLLLLVEIGAIEQLPRLLFEQRVQRERAIRNLILRCSLRSGLGLPCGWDAPGPLLALRHSYLRRLANVIRLQADCNPTATLGPTLPPDPRQMRARAFCAHAYGRMIRYQRIAL